MKNQGMLERQDQIVSSGEGLSPSYSRNEVTGAGDAPGATDPTIEVVVEEVPSLRGGNPYGLLRRAEIVAAIAAEGMKAEARRYARCRLRPDLPDGTKGTSHGTCGFWFCNRCGRSREKAFARLYRARIEQVLAVASKRDRVMFLTITIPSPPLETSTIRTFGEALTAFANLFYPGAVAVIEAGKSHGTIHGHMVVVGRYVRQQKLTEAWRSLWLAGGTVYIQHVDREQVGEVLAYMLKPPRCEPELVAKLVKAFQGVRRVRGIGCFRRSAGR